MSQRTQKVASLVQQIVASELTRLPSAALRTVTRVEVSPDLRQATAWIGILAPDKDQAASLFNDTLAIRKDIQESLAQRLTTKFVPRLSLARDDSGEYVDQITRLIRGL